jgi:uncharacterized protein
MGKNILITGASGLIGTRLTEILLKRGHQVSHIGRTRRSKSVPQFIWDIELGIMDPRAIANADVIIHLAGTNVADERWTQKRKSEILQSRVKSTEVLYNVLKKGTYPVKTIVSASAIGYYGFENEKEIFTEDSPAGTDFLAQVTQQWESEVDKISSLGIRVAKIRTGVVLSEQGGALKEMAKPVKLGLGAALGSGHQYVSWIHLDDLCMIFCKAVEDPAMHGPYNAVAPNPVTNVDMTRSIAKVLKRPFWLPAVPAFLLKMALGEMAVIVTKGNQVSAAKIMKAGFEFQYPDLENTLRNLYKV